MTKCFLGVLLSVSFAAHSAVSPLPNSARVELPALDRAKLSVEDNVSDKKVGPFRYAVPISLSTAQSKRVSVDNGQWQTFKTGEMVWQGEIAAAGASTVDVLLKPFWLPQNAKLTIFDGTGKQVWGPFGHEQNNLANTLPLPLVSGETMRIELSVPTTEREFVRLAVQTVNQGYRALDVVDGQLVAKEAGGCNVDVICPAGDPYRDQVRGVVRILANGGLCTGTLTNNTRNDRAALLLTANHCNITAANASGVMAYYNYQRSTCRALSSGTVSSPPPEGGALLQLGASFVSAARKSDFTLLRLNGSVPSAANAFWLGWDRRDIAPSGAAVIHHPRGEEKRVSIENDALSVSNVLEEFDTISLAPGAALYVPNWDVGTTEGGSSGSALLTRDTKRIVGTLSGGEALCSGTTNNGRRDIFGRLFTSWEGENTAATRLKDHLDPLGTAPQVLDGIGLCNAPSISLNVNLPSPSSRDDVTYTASASGGVAPYSYAWDLDGDGVTDRTSTSNVITTRYDRARSIDVRLSVTDAAGCLAQVTRAMNIVAPDLRLDTLAASTELCGDGDSGFDPGERWRINANVKNFSFPALNAFAQFSPGGTSNLAAADSFGYRYSDASGVCPANTYVDISAQPPLTLTQSGTFNALDDGRTANLTLGSNAFEYYGELANSVAMSTNGYVIINPTSDMRGGDFRPNCGNVPTNNVDLGRRIRILHRDLKATALRAASSAVCPRASTVGAASQPCVILDWAGMRFLNGSGEVETGNFDMQVLLYPQTKQLVYQFRGDLPSVDVDLAVSGLMNTTTNAYNYMCQATGPAKVAAGKAVCYFHPSAQPTVSPLVVTQGAGVLGSVASGQSISTSADVKIPADAACGTSLGLNYQAGIDDRAVSTVTARLNLTVAPTCNVVNNCPLPAQIAMRGGSFFNPARPGNGLVSFLISRPAPQVPLFFGAWFTGEPNRNLTWYIVVGDLLGNQVNAQILQTKRNVASPTFSTTNTDVGTAQISLIEPEKFLFSYQFTGGSNIGRSGGEIMQHVFAGLVPALPDITGHYYNSAESGWGQTYESYIGQGVPQQFMLTYLYDAAGEPRWVLSSFADTLASGPSNTYEVHCPGCAWLDIAPTTKSAGTQSRKFSNGFGNAIISTQFVLPAPLSGSWIKNAVTITPLSDQPK